MIKFNLPTMNDGAKSFYGKAIVIEKDNGEIELQSYNTIVCKLTAGENRRLVRLWNGYSHTTMRHINAFLDYYKHNGGGKAWWDKLRVG